MAPATPTALLGGPGLQNIYNTFGSVSGPCPLVRPMSPHRFLVMSHRTSLRTEGTMSRDGYLPPGVGYSDLPGNRPADVAFDRAYETIYDVALLLVEHGFSLLDATDMLNEQWEAAALDFTNAERARTGSPA